MLAESHESFVYNSSIGIHSVSADGIILYANMYELEILGYDKDEYVGHHVSEFQMDKFCLDDMMQRLGNFETLKNYPARVQGKNEIKYILYNSSVCKVDGQFEHTRCYANEIDEAIYQVFKRQSPYFNT